MHTHYDNLKVARDAPAEVIKAAYRALARRHHPDRNPDDADAARTMQAINDSYAVLCDPARRREHDAWIERQQLRSTAPLAPAPARVRQADASRVAPETSHHTRALLRRHRRVAAALAASLALAAGTAAMFHRPRGELPREGGPASVDSEWQIQALDPSDPVQAQAKAAVAAARRQTAQALARRTLEMPDVAFPTIDMPATVPPIGPIAPMPDLSAPLAFASDPNGRPWPAAAGYVEGFPQGFTEGLTTVTVDNRGNPSAVFLKLVSLDHDPAPAVRHVYVPAHQQFRMESLRPGRYEVRYHELLTGRLSRSEPFHLQQIEDGDRTHFSEIDITLYRVPGGDFQTRPIALEAF